MVEAEELQPWGKQDNRWTAHITHVQDSPETTTIAMSEMQLLELLGMMAAAMREKAQHPDGYHFAIRKQAADRR